ncbi:MAG: hypothetical protein ACTHU0_02615 [Kofleriaceae bacterium]
MLAASAEPLLIAVVSLLALVILGLVAMALLLRRRARTQAAPALEAPAPPPVAPARPVVPRARPRPAVVRGGGGGGLAVATSSAMVCPTCRTEYHGMTYCTRDARRLVPPEEMLGSGPLGAMRGGTRSAGLVCMACRRAYEPGLRSCPHDGNELVPFPVYNATRPRKRGATEPAGVIARICPVCATKYDLNARFCGHDAGELVVIN